MGAESREPELDVDSLFSNMGASDRPAPTGKVHSAVTLRPDPGVQPFEAAPASVPTPVTVSATISRAALISVPAAVQPAAAVAAGEAPDVPVALVEPLGIVESARGVAGYVLRDADGALTSHGATDARFADRVAYLTRLAMLVGDELGLEGLREVHVLGTERRLATLLARDGSSVAVLATIDAPLDDFGTRKR